MKKKKKPIHYIMAFTSGPALCGVRSGVGQFWISEVTCKKCVRAFDLKFSLKFGIKKPREKRKG